MSRPRDDRQAELFRPALEQIIDLGHPLVRLAVELDWDFGDAFWRSVSAGLRAAAIADPADRRAADPQAHA